MVLDGEGSATLEREILYMSVDAAQGQHRTLSKHVVLSKECE